MKNPNIILITGASSGIGQALALAYAQKGVKLLLTGRDSVRLAAVEKACREKGAAVRTATLDITDKQACEKQFGGWDDMEPVDLVIANAGISGGLRDDAERVIATNVNGMVHTIEPFIKRMQKRKKGQIAIVSSLAGFRGLPNAPAYSTSKVANRAYGEALRPLLAKDGIEVNVIMPGFVRSRITDANTFKMPMLMDAEKAAHIIKTGLEKNKARIAFPFPMFALTWLMAALPHQIGGWLLSLGPKK